MLLRAGHGAVEIEKPQIPKLRVSSQKSIERAARDNAAIATANGLSRCGDGCRAVLAPEGARPISDGDSGISIATTGSMVVGLKERAPRRAGDGALHSNGI